MQIYVYIVHMCKDIKLYQNDDTTTTYCDFTEVVKAVLRRKEKMLSAFTANNRE